MRVLTPPTPRRAEAGYNMVVLMVAVTVLNILVAAMLPLWSTQIRRDKEEELIFRGWQYAEAIRVYNRRFTEYPTKLEQLIERKPRCIRQLWKDPMTEDGKWELVFKDQPQEPPPDPNGRDQGEIIKVGPIIGVRSKSREKSIIVLFGRERYDQWEFTERWLVPGDPSKGIGPTGQAQGFKKSTRWIGRPLRFVYQPPVPPDPKPPNP